MSSPRRSPRPAAASARRHAPAQVTRPAGGLREDGCREPSLEVHCQPFGGTLVASVAGGHE